jgi:hypothetical protein
VPDPSRTASRLYEDIRNVDYSGMTDLVDVIDRKIDDDGIGTASS